MKLHLTTAIEDGEFKKDLPPCESSFDVEELSEIVDQYRIQSEEIIPNLLKALEGAMDAMKEASYLPSQGSFDKLHQRLLKARDKGQQAIKSTGQ